MNLETSSSYRRIIDWKKLEKNHDDYDDDECLCKYYHFISNNDYDENYTFIQTE